MHKPSCRTDKRSRDKDIRHNASEGSESKNVPPSDASCFVDASEVGTQVTGASASAKSANSPVMGTWVAISGLGDDRASALKTHEAMFFTNKEDGRSRPSLQSAEESTVGSFDEPTGRD
jgi:hypothetical protein